MVDCRIRTLVEVARTSSVKKIPLKELSTLLGINYSYLSRLIKRNMNCTYSCFMKKMRIQRALAYLDKTDKPIKEIVILAGYKSTSHFYKDFRALVDCTPKNYQARNRRLLSNTLPNRMPRLMNRTRKAG